ncbi:MAG: hypothetical protein IKI06_09545 [Prevotella sp.]|nr:hypothetical protein [Prevotella sp.]
MKTRHYILLIPLFLLMVLLTVACSNDTVADEPQPLPEGMGRIRITICTPENNSEQTRAVNVTPWEEPDHEWERLQTFRILICNKSDNKVVQIISGTKAQMTEVTGNSSYPYKRSVELESEPIATGDYYIYATANYADGYGVGDVVDPDKTVRFPNGYSESNIPMTGKLTTEVGGSTMKTVTVSEGTETNAGTITVWRVMSKLQFYFTSEATEKIDIYGIEVEPINTNASDQGLVYLFSKDDLTSTDNLAVGGVNLPTTGVTNGKVRHQTSTTDPLLKLNAWSGTGDKPTGTLFFYVNETNGTFTTTQNEISLRFKVRRQSTPAEEDDELRYGLTTRYGDGSTGQNGFNVMRRNDWIHIPIILTDWQYRIEPLAFVPIAGYPPATVSSDGLTATFETGGMIALQPFIKKKSDDTWRDFSSPEVTFVSVHWKNSDTGDDPSGDGKIVKTAFTYDPVTKCIIGELNNDKTGSNSITTITVNVDLGTSPLLYHYTFSCNVILQ